MTGRHTLIEVFRRAIGGPFASSLGIPALRSVAIRVANIGLSLGVSILLARILGADGLGVYAGAMAVVTLLAVPAGSGVPFSLVQLISRYLAANELAYARGSIRWGYAQVLGAGLLLGSFGAIGVVNFISSENNALPAYLLAFSLLPLLCLTSVQRGILNALEFFTLSQVPQSLIRPGFLAALLIAWMIFWPEYKGHAGTAMSMQLSAHVVAFLVGAVFLGRFGSRALPHGPRAYDFRRWYGVSLPLVVSGAAGVVLSQTDLVMLSWLEPPASAGLYRVAVGASFLVALPLMAVNIPLAPAVARGHELQIKDELQRMLTFSVRWAFAGCLPIALVFILAGDWLLGVVYGWEFAIAYPVLVVLALAQVFSVAAGSVDVVLQMTGHQHNAARGLLIAAGVNVALNAALIPAFGPLGAAFATGASIVLWNALMLHSVVRKLNVDPTLFGRTRS